MSLTNVLVDDGHHVRIAEFGLSKVKSSSASITDAIPSGSALGKRTLAFIAPELLQDNAMSFTTDVYAFATSVYQVIYLLSALLCILNEALGFR